MYSYENYDKVKNEIEKRRMRAISEADTRSEYLREISPEIKDIDDELSQTGLLLFKTACSGGEISPIRKRNVELLSRRREIIKSLGYPEDHTDVHYSCKDCSDTGFINGTKMCHCFREALIKETIASSGIGDLIDKQTFDNFDLEWYKDDNDAYEAMRANLAAARSYVSSFAKKRANLLLIGKTGTGKTHISTAIAREVISLGFDVVYDSAQNIISDFESDKFRSGYGTEQRSAKYLECDLLIIDDLGTEFQSSFTVSCLYNLINTRHNRGLATIISTNLSPDELVKKYEDRIYSRLVGHGTHVLLFRGKDKRIFG